MPARGQPLPDPVHHITRPKPVTRRGFEAVHQVVYQEATVVATFVFSVSLAISGHMLDGSIALLHANLTRRPVPGTFQAIDMNAITCKSILWSRSSCLLLTRY